MSAPEPARGPGPAARGLSAAELAAVALALQDLRGTVVAEITGITAGGGTDDLLLVLRTPAGGGKSFLHVALGGPRARLTTTSRRFQKQAFTRSTGIDLLQRELTAAQLVHVVHALGERRCALHFTTKNGDRRLVVELFGSRGLWVLLDAESRVLALPREVQTAVRTLRLGEPYAAPPPSTLAGAPAGAPIGSPSANDAESRFPDAVLPAIDAHFTHLDLAIEATAEHDQIVRAAQRALQKATAKAAGIGEQIADAGRSQRLREQADMMLAFAHTVRRGAAEMTFPDLLTGEPHTIAIDPAKPVVMQAQTLYEKARRLDDGRAIAERRHAEATATIAVLTQLLTGLGTLVAGDPAGQERLAAARATLQHLGALPATKPPPTARPRERPSERENFRRFVSAEGYTILVGRDNEQNDRLTMRTANGNDLWLHVGGGRPGSHVVVRLPKQKTASLETLLDAAALAVHFSKARGEHRIEVVYTQRKHVRKPKGLPAGAVVPSQTKSITSSLDEARLRRLLDSAGADDPT